MSRQPQPTLALLGQLVGAAAVAPLLLSLAALTLCVTGVFVTWGVGPGLIAAGIACMVLEWRVMGGAEAAAGAPGIVMAGQR